MKTTFKKLVSLALCFIFLVSMTIPIASANEGSALQDSLTDYINESLQHYLSIEYTGEYDDIQISQGFSVDGNTDENSRTYFVTDDEQLIGCLSVTLVDGEYRSGFFYDSNPEITAAIKNYTPIKLIVVDDKLVMKTADSMVAVSSGIQFDVALALSSESTKRNELNEIALKTVNIDATRISSNAESSPQRASDTAISLAVPYVANTAVGGVGICWAASIAAISNYRNGSTYSAVSLYNGLQFDYGGVPKGAEPWYSRGFSACNMGAPVVTGSAFYSSARSILPGGKPIMVCVTNMITAHAVVLKYLQQTSNPPYDIITTYGFMDSNYSSTQYAAVHNGSAFVYAPGATTYNLWFESVY